MSKTERRDGGAEGRRGGRRDGGTEGRRDGGTEGRMDARRVRGTEEGRFGAGVGGSQIPEAEEMRQRGTCSKHEQACTQ